MAQAVLQLDISVLVNILRFEALLECPIIDRNGRYASIANARRHLQNFFAKVLKTCIVVAQRLIDLEQILIAFASHDGSIKLVVIELLDVRARLTLFATTIW